ncbi:glycosyltransferase family 2 protein [Lacinutrix sp. Hel_I_90]|uniref:glycosyltransferase family 2 protein n=1 Tax=Lacinutrix sp. Hel_I_90 TaxID=1249999 RepID=UPI0006972D25|nr:glycosyltransferase family 2 protein [Lacinutrix sp. Hel_I_90]
MISIIIPIYNRAHLIEETLHYISDQTYKNWECIIVDDGSDDNTVNTVKNYIRKDIRFTLYKRPKNKVKGPSSCRNYGVSLSKGEYIQFFDSDDIMHPEHLQKKREAIMNHDFVVCQLQAFKGHFDTHLFTTANQPEILYSSNVFEDFATGTFPMMMLAPLWKAATIKKYLPIREDLHILEDHDLYARALFNTKTYAIINKPLIFYRVGESSSTHNFYTNVDYGLESYLEAKRTVLNLSASNKIRLAILKMTLGFFRQALAERNMKAANNCLDFITKNQLAYTFDLKLKMSRIHFFYRIFKFVKRGDTKFKPLFKL